MTNEQEIRAAAAAILFRHTPPAVERAQEPGVKPGPWEIALDHYDHLRALERYIRDGFDGPGKGYVTTEDLRRTSR
jgi:hypothetical protein